MPTALRLKTHRVEAGEQLVCDQSKTFPERGDIVFQFTNPDGVLRTFRRVNYAEMYLKSHPEEKP